MGRIAGGAGASAAEARCIATLGPDAWLLPFCLQETDPLFVDEEHLNLALQDGSPARELPGFEPIPFDEIGIQP